MQFVDSTGTRFEPMTTGALLDRAFRLYAANFALMAGITAVAYVPFYLAILVIESRFGIEARVASDALAAASYIVISIVLWTSVVFPIAGGAATYAISERYLGNEVTIADALRRGLSCFWTISLAEVTATIRMIFGFFLLIVPGILWMLSYTLIVPVILLEGRAAIPSLARSRDLMKGQRGKALCIALVTVLLQLVVGAGVEMILSPIFPDESGEGMLLNSALSHLMTVLTTPVFIITTILLYYDMRIRKEGFDLEMLSRALAGEPGTLVAAPKTQTP